MSNEHPTCVIDRFEGPYFFLSNFYEFPITYFGDRYPSTENAYQAAKVDPTVRDKPCADKTGKLRHWFEHLTLPPGKSKKLGRILPLRDGWDKGIKDTVMKEVLAIKFSDPQLQKWLLDTGDAKLIEGNWWGDTYWGVCEGMGLNKLGIALMYLRTRIRLENALN